jgi:site-specific recombinase XerD
VRWTPELIEHYVSGEARRYRPSTGQNIACATRSFLRFLLQEGLIRSDLSAAVPSFAHWRLGPLPKTLREEELAQLTKAADVRTPMGLRNRAMLLCMTELGMRASDVAGLELNGVDIAARVLRLHRRKERRSATLPMTDKLAHAIDAYLRRGRPVCPSQSIFVLHRAPVGKPITPVGICYVVLGLAKRAGLRDRIGGTHILRHSVACRMLNAGATLKQVADLLGHRSINTTTIYAKVDLNALSQVPLPWPGAEEVQR